MVGLVKKLKLRGFRAGRQPDLCLILNNPRRFFSPRRMRDSQQQDRNDKGENRLSET